MPRKAGQCVAIGLASVRQLKCGKMWHFVTRLNAMLRREKASDFRSADQAITALYIVHFLNVICLRVTPFRKREHA